jgi:mono/diheme cytochrome c family protein
MVMIELAPCKYTTHLEVSVHSIFLRVIMAGLVLASLAGIGVMAQGNPEAAKVKNPVEATPESIATGKQLYARYCAVCHGINGEGGSGSDISPPAPNIVDAEWKHGSTDGEIFDVIKNGIPPDLNMGPLGDRIKDPDIWNVVNYVRSLAKKN